MKIVLDNGQEIKLGHIGRFMVAEALRELALEYRGFAEEGKGGWIANGILRDADWLEYVAGKVDN